jgi:hypothetical protein
MKPHVKENLTTCTLKPNNLETLKPCNIENLIPMNFKISPYFHISRNPLNPETLEPNYLKIPETMIP